MSIIRTYRGTATRTPSGWVIEIETGFDPAIRTVQSRHRSTVRQAAEQLAADYFQVPVSDVAVQLEWIR